MLLDTSGLLCVHDRLERFHQEAAEAFRNARQLLP